MPAATSSFDSSPSPFLSAALKRRGSFRLHLLLASCGGRVHFVLRDQAVVVGVELGRTSSPCAASFAAAEFFLADRAVVVGVEAGEPVTALRRGRGVGVREVVGAVAASSAGASVTRAATRTDFLIMERAPG